MMPFDLGSIFWMAMTLFVAIIAVTLFLVHEFVILPKIARQMRHARWTKSVCAFIQDDTGNVRFTTSKNVLPEGVIHNEKGWFILPRGTKITRRGRPAKNKEEIIKEEEIKKYMVHVPILQGLGKQVFFGSVGGPMLSNLWTLAHADLLKAEGFLPVQTQQTLLDAIANWSRLEGMKMVGGDLVRWIFYVILAVIPIAVIGLVFWFLTQG